MSSVNSSGSYPSGFMERPSVIKASMDISLLVEPNYGPNCTGVAPNQEDGTHLANTQISIRL